MSGLMFTRWMLRCTTWELSACPIFKNRVRPGRTLLVRAETLGALSQILLYRFFTFLACKYTVAPAMVCLSIITNHTGSLFTRTIGPAASPSIAAEEDVEFHSHVTARHSSRNLKAGSVLMS